MDPVSFFESFSRHFTVSREFMLNIYNIAYKDELASQILLCLAPSNKRIPAAIAALRDSMFPCMGM